MNWLIESTDLCVAAKGDVTFVMTLNRAAGRRNRWTLTALWDHGQESTILALECTPGQCRRLAKEVVERNGTGFEILKKSARKLNPGYRFA